MQNITKNEYESVINQNNITVVDFWASWCGPCKMLAPVYEKVAGEMQECLFVKVNVDEEQEIATKNQIYSIPTIILFKAGKELARKSGYMSEAELKNFINSSKK